MTRKLLFWFGIATLFALVFALVIYGASVPRWSESDVRETIARDLPIGSSKSMVTAWLKSQPHVKDFSDVIDLRTQKIVGMGATIPNSGPALWRSSEEIYIQFDMEADKLISVDVHKRQMSF
jgi:hypothetical protein